MAMALTSCGELAGAVRRHPPRSLDQVGVDAEGDGGHLGLGAEQHGQAVGPATWRPR